MPATRDPQTPLVSVIMPVHNGGPFLATAVQSVLDQSLTDLELVVVDDGSTDSTPAVLAAVDDARLVVVRQENRGEAAARNTGLDHSRGALVAWQDADDIALPHRLAVQVEALSGGAGFAHCDVLLIDAEDRPLGTWRSSALPRRRVLPFLLRAGTPFNNPTMVVRRDLIRDLRHDETLCIGTDTDFVRRFATRSEGIHVPEPLVLYRRHAASATTGLDPSAGFAQVQRLLDGHPLDDLVPDAARSFDPGPDAVGVGRVLVAGALLRRGFAEPALAWFESAASTPLDSAAGSYVSAVVAQAAGDHAHAVATAARLPDSALALCLRARLAVTSGDLATAAQLARGALAHDPWCDEAVVVLRVIGELRGGHTIDPSLRGQLS